jgi:hypothetical protein
MTTTLEIERSQWSDFLDRFSRLHEGWLVTIEEIRTLDGTPAVEARALPLENVSADEDGTIAVSVGGKPDCHLTHLVSRAARLLVEQTDEGVDQAIRIERHHGPSTRVAFRSAMRPEEVDGLLST